MDLRKFGDAVDVALKELYRSMEAQGFKPSGVRWGRVTLTDNTKRGVRTENGTSFGHRVDLKEIFQETKT